MGVARRDRRPGPRASGGGRGPRLRPGGPRRGIDAGGARRARGAVRGARVSVGRQDRPGRGRCGSTAPAASRTRRARPVRLSAASR